MNHDSSGVFGPETGTTIALFGIMYKIAMLLALLLSGPVRAGSTPDFALQDGDRVVFFGDSNTHMGSYGEMIEEFTHLRYPKRNIRFFNAGVAGDTAAGALGRMENDVFAKKPTVVFILFGVNDIVWGLSPEKENQRSYVNAVQAMVKQCQNHGVRAVYVLSYPVTEPAAKSPPPMANGSRSYDSARANFYLHCLFDEVKASPLVGTTFLDTGEEVARILAKMKQQDQYSRFHAPDGVHLNQEGNEAVAYSILTALHASPLVSSVEINASSLSVTERHGAEVEGLTGTVEGIQFTRMDSASPAIGNLFPGRWTFGSETSEGAFPYGPFNESLNQYWLKVSHLKPGRYLISVDGNVITNPAGLRAEDLKMGVNIAALERGPYKNDGQWDVAGKEEAEAAEAESQLEILSHDISWYENADPQRRARIESARSAAVEAIAKLQREITEVPARKFVIKRIGAE